MGCVTDPESAVSPLLTHVAGASAQDGTGVGGVTARHYGEPLVEQLRLERGPGVVDGWDRTAVLVTGPEAATWLNTLTSQKLDALATGAATSSLILDIQGRVLHHFGVSALPDGLLLDTPTAAADALAGYLRSMVFWAKVEVTVPDLTRLTVVGAPGTPGRCGTGSPADPVVPGAVAWTSRRLGGYDAVDVWVPRDGVTAAWDALTAAGVRPTGALAGRALRIRDRLPVLGEDTDDRVIPHEVPAFMGPGATGPTRLADAADGPSDGAVHLNKGCYRGQETVSRVQNLGRPPRSLVMIHLDGTANRLPAPGEPVVGGGRTVGRAGVAVHDAEEGPVVLALVKRAVLDALAAGTDVPPLTVDGVDAAVDPRDLTVDDSPRPGREAVSRLRDAPRR